jgi:hypothetical protein
MGCEDYRGKREGEKMRQETFFGQNFFSAYYPNGRANGDDHGVLQAFV